MKVAIIGNQARAMNNFWTVLIRNLIKKGHSVICFVPNRIPTDDPKWDKMLEELGAKVVHYPLNRKGLNPFQDINTILSLSRLLKQEKPDVSFSYTIKPIIYGSFAGALSGFPLKRNRHVMLTGIGFMFEGGSFFKNSLLKIAKYLYSLAFTMVNGIFFQNLDDKELFASLKITKPTYNIRMSKGTGVDISYFEQKQPFCKPITFLFIGRLLEAKGLRELKEAAKLLHQKYSNVKVQILGPQEPGVGNVPLEEVLNWQESGLIEYLGETFDVRPFIEKSSVIVLPSWREGTPCSLMEAMSMGRPIIAADAPGSREVVRDSINGLKVPVKDPLKLAEAMEYFINNPNKIQEMGISGRKIVEDEYDAEKVAQRLISDMNI